MTSKVTKLHAQWSVYNAHSWQLANVEEIDARNRGSSRMYLLKAELCHRPNVCIAESSRPATAAVVAAPILKLCPA